MFPRASKCLSTHNKIMLTIITLPLPLNTNLYGNITNFDYFFLAKSLPLLQLYKFLLAMWPAQKLQVVHMRPAGVRSRPLMLCVFLIESVIALKNEMLSSLKVVLT